MPGDPRRARSGPRSRRPPERPGTPPPARLLRVSGLPLGASGRQPSARGSHSGDRASRSLGPPDRGRGRCRQWSGRWRDRQRRCGLWRSGERRGNADRSGYEPRCGSCGRGRGHSRWSSGGPAHGGCSAGPTCRPPHKAGRHGGPGDLGGGHSRGRRPAFLRRADARGAGACASGAHPPEPSHWAAEPPEAGHLS
jgi:hypothetical protein